MRRNSEFQESIDKMVLRGVAHQVLGLNAEDEAFDGRHIRLNGRDLINFGSCSYMGLELDDRLKAGAIEAIQRYGSQFSSSRAYVSMPLYVALESELEKVFGLPPLIVPTTSLGHVAALPVLIAEGDAVLIDQQVHASVQMALNHIRIHHIPTEIIRHNRMDLLEERLKVLKHHRKVWYMADGLYSMYGDWAPLDELSRLLNTYENFHLYLDDAHAMSWQGNLGRGYGTSLLKHHDKVVVATSLNKAFAAGGGVVLVPDPQTRQRIQRIGGPLMFSGPLQPATLGAALASARIHASGEIETLQGALRERILLCNRLCQDYGLPLFSMGEAPIRFIAAGLSQVAFSTAAKLKEEGFFVNAAAFPSVPMTHAGLRFTLTLHQSPDDIERLIAAIARHLPRELEAEGRSLSEVRRSFGLPDPIAMERRIPPLEVSSPAPTSGLTLHRYSTIEDLPQEEWDQRLGQHGTIDVAGLRYLEQTFQGNAKKEENWKFHYFVVRDESGTPVLATFFTEALWKDDMTSEANVSAAAERRREQDPYYLTSQTLSMGSLLTEGTHLYLNRQANWRGAMTLLLREVERERELSGATGLAFRDIAADDHLLDTYLQEQGYLRVPMPDSAWMELGWDSDGAYMTRLSDNSRKHQRKKVLPFEDFYTVEIIHSAGRKPSPEEYAHYHRLYAAVHARNMDLNVFALPPSLFPAMWEHPEWELILLHLKPEYGGDESGLPVALVACFRGEGRYVPLICGLDYRFVHSHGAYRQLLRQAIMRGNAEGFGKLHLGLGAIHEKTRFGAQIRRHYGYFKFANDYQMGVLRELTVASKRASHPI